MAKDLRGFPRFPDITHVTLNRWLAAEKKGELLPERAQEAIELLSIPKLETLRIPFHDAPLALPLMILDALPDSQRTFKIERPDVSSGVEALEKLAGGHAEVAIAWRHARRSEPARKRCARISEFVTYDLESVMSEESARVVRVRSDLRTLKFGYPETSAVGEFLATNVSFEALPDLAPKGYPTAETAGDALKEGEVNCLLGWPPWTTRVRELISTGSHGSLPIGILPPIELDLFVSTATRKGPVILRFLRELQRIIADRRVILLALEAHRIKDIAERIGASSSDDPRLAIEALIENYDFHLDDSLRVLFSILRETEIAS